MTNLNGWVIFLSIIASFVAILLAVIGALLKYGIDAIRSDIKSIWEWIKVSDLDKVQLARDMATTKSHIEEAFKAIEEIKGTVRSVLSRCELHLVGGKRWYDPAIRPDKEEVFGEHGERRS